MARVSAQLIRATVRAAPALDRLRNGDLRAVVVQYVTAGDGGQAVVAGAVAPGGRRKWAR